MRTLITVGTICAGLALAQDAPAPVPMNAVEQAWADSMNNVKMIGYFMMGDSKDLHDDAYTIEKITKVSDGVWKFAARIQYGGRDVKVALNVPVDLRGRYAGDQLPASNGAGSGNVQRSRAVLQGRLRRHLGRWRSRRHHVRQDREDRRHAAGHARPQAE